MTAKVLSQSRRGSMSGKFDAQGVMKKMREAELNLTGKRFCSSCQTMQPAEQGKMLEGKVRRWKCNTCLAKASKRLYKSKETV